MDPHATACAALQKVLVSAPALRFIVGFDQSVVLETQVDDALKRLQASSEVTPHVVDALCTLAHTCMSLVNSVDEDMITGMNECFDGGALLVWGFSVEVAESICFSLTAVANTIKSDAVSAASFEIVGRDLDNLAVHLFGGLCRLDAVSNSSSPDARLLNAFQCICVWTLAILQQFVGNAGITSEVLWEWVSEDPLWAFVLAKGVLLFRTECAPEVDVGLMAPANILYLKNSAIGALAGLTSPSIAFRGELEADLIADDLDGGFPMAHRLVGLAQHRAKLAVAAVDSDVLDTIVREALKLGGPSWLPSAVCLLAKLTMQPSADATAWAEVQAVQEEWGQPQQDIFTLTDACGVADALVAQASVLMDALWNLITSTIWVSVSKHRSFLADCATLAFVLPPHAGVSHEIFVTGFQDQIISSLEPTQVAALCALATNSGLLPNCCKPFADVLQLLNVEMKMRVAERAARCRIPIRNDEAWRLWSEVLGVNASSPEPPQSDLRSPPQASSVPRPTEKVSSRPGIRELMQGAPRELCCSLDGKLLVDPVRSPHGQLFERSNLIRMLTATPGLCPVTGLPLAIEACPRAPDIRIQAQRWVRQVRPMERVV